MTQPVGRDAMLNATRDLPSVRLSEIVLRTARFQEANDWYQAVLGIDPFLLNGQVSFRRLHTDYPYTQVLAIFNRPDLHDNDDKTSGLDHIQLRHATLGDMFTRYERLKAVGITPHRSMNHGPGTSFYYRDPDGNTVELSGPNFERERDYLAYFESEAFRKNIAGIPVDPDEFVGRFRRGEPLGELVRI